MYPSFMESIWWVFKELYNKGLVYKGSKVMPFSTACNTPLSNFESGQNYKDVVDPAGENCFYSRISYDDIPLSSVCLSIFKFLFMNV
jgi:isoleucyl-tRNA synthetase